MPTLLPSEAQVRGNPTKAVVDAIRVRGADQVVPDHLTRDSLDPDVRKAGMHVRTSNDGQTWELGPDLATWVQVIAGGGGGGGGGGVGVGPQALATRVGGSWSPQAQSGFVPSTQGLVPKLTNNQGRTWSTIIIDPISWNDPDFDGPDLWAMFRSGGLVRHDLNNSFTTPLSLDDIGHYPSLIYMVVGGKKLWVLDQSYGLIRVNAVPNKVAVESVMAIPQPTTYFRNSFCIFYDAVSFPATPRILVGGAVIVLTSGGGTLASSELTVVDPAGPSVLGFYQVPANPPDGGYVNAITQTGGSVWTVSSTMSGLVITKWSTDLSTATKYTIDGTLVNPNVIRKIEVFGGKMFVATPDNLYRIDVATGAVDQKMPWPVTMNDFAINPANVTICAVSVTAGAFEVGTIMGTMVPTGQSTVIGPTIGNFSGYQTATTGNAGLTSCVFSPYYNQFFALDRYNEVVFYFSFGSAASILLQLGGTVEWKPEGPTFFDGNLASLNPGSYHTSGIYRITSGTFTLPSGGVGATADGTSATVIYAMDPSLNPYRPPLVITSSIPIRRGNSQSNTVSIPSTGGTMKFTYSGTDWEAV